MKKKAFFYNLELIVTLAVVLLLSGCGSSSSSSSAPPDTTAPTAPASLTAVAASWNKVIIRWITSTDNVGVTGYTINRNGSPLVTVTTATTVYSDTTCTGSTTYTYTVAAHDAANNISLSSPSATTTTFLYGTSDTLTPNAPTGLIVTASTSTQISLSWNASTDNEGVSGYNIYRSASKIGTPAIIGTSITTSYTDTGLTSTTPYFYQVTAFDGALNESTLSGQLQTITQ